MTTLETLKAARERIAKPENWTTGAYLRSGNGVALSSAEKARATQCCAIGAIFLAQPGCESVLDAEIDGAYTALLSAAGMPPTRYNDTHTHAEVLALFDKAIASLGGGK